MVPVPVMALASSTHSFAVIRTLRRRVMVTAKFHNSFDLFNQYRSILIKQTSSTPPHHLLLY